MKNDPLEKIGAVVGIIETDRRHFQTWITLDSGKTIIPIANYATKERANEIVAVVRGWMQEEEMIRSSELFARLDAVKKTTEYPIEYISEAAQNMIRRQMRYAVESGYSTVPRYTKELNYFEEYCRESKEAARVLAIQNIDDIRSREHAGETTANTIMCLRLIASERRLECQDTCPIVYLEPSALKMIDYVRYSDNKHTVVPTTPLWVHPLAPLKIRDEYIVGIFIYDPYDTTGMWEAHERRLAKRPLPSRQAIEYEEFAFHIAEESRFQWFIEIVTQRFERIGEDGITIKTGMTAFVFNYDAEHDEWNLNLQWQTEHCPTNKCFSERLGEAQILIPCTECRNDLQEWSTWIRTMLDVRAGKFRQERDTRGNDKSTGIIETVTPPKNKRDKPHKTRKVHQTETVSYDVSYFKRRKEHITGGPLQDNHLVLSVEEALREGALELDLDGVLIRYPRGVRAHTRKIVDKDGVDRVIDVKGKDDKIYYVTLAHWKGYQEKREEEQKKRRVEDIRASRYETK